MTTTSLIDALQADMRAARPGSSIDVQPKQSGDKWTAHVKAGFADGAFPVWQATAASRDQAIEHAVSSAAHYWGVLRGSPY